MEEDIFKYPDTHSTRANVDDLNKKIRGQKIAIIGLGGTGSYILDLISKTHVKEIHIYDGDIFQVHNAFRAPGALGSNEFRPELKKVDYFHGVYSKLRYGIFPHDKYVTKENINDLVGFSYVFISVDKNEVRSMICEELLKIGVTFFDAGLGVNRGNGFLNGTIRVTTGSVDKNDHLVNRIGSAESNENEYATNIQMAELNCLNATLAVLAWKKKSGFYQDLKGEHNQLFLINTNKIINDDHHT